MLRKRWGYHHKARCWQSPKANFNPTSSNCASSNNKTLSLLLLLRLYSFLLTIFQGAMFAVFSIVSSRFYSLWSIWIGFQSGPAFFWIRTNFRTTRHRKIRVFTFTQGHQTFLKYKVSSRCLVNTHGHRLYVWNRRFDLRSRCFKAVPRLFTSHPHSK